MGSGRTESGRGFRILESAVMLGAMQNRGTIVQYGSGRPGEEGSDAFERAVFLGLGLQNPSIAFLPFHPLGPGENDWTRFLDIHRRLTTGAIELIQLVPFQAQPDPRDLEKQLSSSRVIVLGSGLVEPYIVSIALSGLDRLFSQLHRSGTVFIGYSAGTLVLGSEFRHYQTGGEILEILEELLEADLKDMPLEDAVQAFCEAFSPAPSAERLIDLVRRKRDGLDPDESDPFLTEVQAKTYCPGLNMVPGVAAYPHYGAPFQCTLPILQRLHAEHPETLHIGLPNATALISTFEPTRRMTVRGPQQHRPVQWIDARGLLRSSFNGAEIPVPAVGKVLRSG